MAKSRINRGGWLAISLAVLGSLVALVREFVVFRSSGAFDWGTHRARPWLSSAHVRHRQCVSAALAVGMSDDSGDAT